MKTIEKENLKEALIAQIQYINLLENSMLEENNPSFQVDTYAIIMNLLAAVEDAELYLTFDEKGLYYARLLRAKCEEVLDIMDVQQAK